MSKDRRLLFSALRTWRRWKRKRHYVWNAGTPASELLQALFLNTRIGFDEMEAVLESAARSTKSEGQMERVKLRALLREVRAGQPWMSHDAEAWYFMFDGNEQSDPVVESVIESALYGAIMRRP